MEEEAYIAHYGIRRRSGRYPWGSGGNEVSRSKGFLEYLDSMRAQGLKDKDIAKALSDPDPRGPQLSVAELRSLNTLAGNIKKAADINLATRLRDKGMSHRAIGEKLDPPRNESYVRTLLKPGEMEKLAVLFNISNHLKEVVAEKGLIDVGSNVNRYINNGISKERLDTALLLLKEEGYNVYRIKPFQATGSGNRTNMRVLAPPGVEWSYVQKNQNLIRQYYEKFYDYGRSILGIHPPLPVSSKRIEVRYADDGGSEADGVIYVRPGVKDLSLGKSNYAQVRILVDGTHYLKGMAMYKDDLPPGTDLVFNTNKDRTSNKLDAMKPIESDPDNPFGSAILPQQTKIMSDGSVKVTSAMNLVNEAGDWFKWKKTLSSQMLSKQSPVLAKEQLNTAYEQRKADFDEIMTLTNPAVRKRMLELFSEDADKASVNLKAAAMKGTASHVILPIKSLSEAEVFAPRYQNGQRVVLIRHPHGGIFEIPELVVNNRNREARKMIGLEAEDAIGINANVAKKLSGADFDGDAVLVIPNDSGKIKTAPSLLGLKDFDPVREYPAYPGMKPMTEHGKQVQMGIISNLITDMTIKGANNEELARAVRHSMVVIDAEKHKLNYKQSALNNNIAQLKERYQSKPDGKAGGSSTIVSRAGSKVYLPHRVPRPAKLGGAVDKETGEKKFVETGESYPVKKVNKRTGEETVEIIPRFTVVKALANTPDARTLTSVPPKRIESLYADHSNRLKALANAARKEAVNTRTIPYSPSAAKTYAHEAKSLKAKLNIALKNAPLERQAHILANAAISAKLQANPSIRDDKAEERKLRYRILEEYRARVGAKRTPVTITQEEWNAIQAGAISNHMLTQILKNADPEKVKQLATPRHQILMAPAKTQRARAMLKGGATQAEVAAALGVSLTTLKNALAE